MTKPDGNADETPSPESSEGSSTEPNAQSGAGSAGPSEPPPSGYEAPSIEHQQPSMPTGWTPAPEYPAGYPPPAYPAPPGFPPPSGPTADYPPPGYFPGGPEAGYPPPYSDPSGYGAPYGGPGHPPPPPYGAPPPGYGPGPTGYPAPDYSGAFGAPTTNSLAIASLVASAVGILCCLGSIAGIVLGIVALNQIKQSNERGHGLAVAGIAVGAATLLISVVWQLIVLNS